MSKNQCQLVGKGPHKVIALHGWFSDRRGYEPLWPHLDEEAFSYAFLDYRGYGSAHQHKGPYTLAGIAQDALAAADELGWGKFSLIGHSMGGIAAMQVVAQAPTRVTSFAGISAVPPTGVPFDEAGWGLFSSAAKSHQSRSIIIDMTTGNRLSKKWVTSMVRNSLEQSSAEAFGAYLPQWARNDISASVAGTKIPMKLFVGQHDPALGEGAARATWLKAFPHAALEVIPSAGHYAPQETPIALVTGLEAFLRA